MGCLGFADVDSHIQQSNLGGLEWAKATATKTFQNLGKGSYGSSRIVDGS